MSESPPAAAAPPTDPEFVKRLDRIEQTLQRIECVRRRIIPDSLVAILVIIGLFLLFFYRLYDYGRNYDRQALLTMVRDDAERILQTHYRLFMQQIEKEKIINHFVDQCLVEFDKVKPQVAGQVDQAIGRLKDHVTVQLQERLYQAIGRALQKQSGDLRKEFVGFDPEKLQKILDESKADFVERLHQIIEERLALVEPSLLGLQSSVEAVAKTGKKEELTPEMVGEIEVRLFETLFELIIYELNPKKGAELIRPEPALEVKKPEAKK